ncbi:polycystin-1-like protein 2 [Glandiceps talaboti]
MLANAMFYQTPDSEGDQTKTLRLGPLSFTLGTLYVSFISCLVTLPATLILVEIFRKSQTIPDCTCCCCCRKKTKDVNGSQEKLTEDEKCIEIKQKKSLPLPWWGKLIGWFLVFACMFLSSFFVVMYSLEWGKEVAHAWLTSEMTSFFLSSCVIDPLKAIGIAALVSLLFMLFKKPLVSETDKDTEIRKYGVTPPSVKVTVKDVQARRRPPSETEVKTAHNRQMKRNRLKATFREFLFYIFFLLFACTIANTYRSYEFYYSNKAVINVLKSDTLMECSVNSCYWDWLKDTVVPAINPQYYYNGKPLSAADKKNPKLSTAVSYMIGPVILRQVRVKRDNCLVHKDMRQTIPYCIPPYTISEEDVGAYNVSWRPYPEIDEDSDETKPWMYDTYYEREIDVAPYFANSETEEGGKTTSPPQSPWVHSAHYDRGVKYAPSFWSFSSKKYSGTGFVGILGTNQDRAGRVVDYLQRNSWIDRYTRGVFLETAIYNPFLKLYSMVTFLVEFSELGDATPSYRVDSLAFLDLFNFSFSTFLAIAFHVGYLIMVLYLLCWWGWKLCSKGRRAVRGIWNLMDFTLAVIAICSVGLFFVRLEANKWAMEELLSNQGKSITVIFCEKKGSIDPWQTRVRSDRIS